ncbi:MAG: hypothetical protein J6Z38_08785, partial [Lachnospiraceae bacterium]|nr:hypothetical protein [Lachnospiraceae bacterium]
RDRLCRILYTCIQWTWGIVQNVIALVLFAVLKLKDPAREVFCWHGVVVTEWKKRSSMGLGMFLFLGHHGIDSYSSRILVHEYGHTIQSCILGPLYLPLIGIPSFLWANVKRIGKKWREGRGSYYAFYTEKWANRAGGRVLKLPTPETPAADTDEES